MCKIDVILNTYERSNLLLQINSIANQTIASNEVHIWNNGNFQNISFPVKVYSSSYNTKYWGRFLIPLISNAEYIAIFDDDMFPQPNWFENCLNTIKKTNGILGGSGVFIKNGIYSVKNKVGWNGVNNDNAVKVDLVGHCWFFRQEWAKYIWYEKPYTWENGEDITFSYLAQKYGGLATYVPPHPVSNKSLWSTNTRLSSVSNSDKFANSIKNEYHIVERQNIVREYIKRGWKCVESA